MRKAGVLIFIVGAFHLSAQNDPLFSHYMFNPAYYNPGWIGDTKMAFASFQHRTQWAGYTTSFDGDGGAPSTQLLTFVLPMQGRFSSAGMNIVHDQLGPESTLKLQVGLSYNVEFRQGVVSFGLMPGLVSRTIRFDQLRFENPEDILNTGQRETQLAPDAAAGIFFRSFSGYFAGFGVDHLLSPSLIGVDGVDSQLARGKLSPTYYLHGGKAMSLSRDLELTPTLLVKTDGRGYTMDVSGVFNYKSSMWAGLSYRRAESMVLLLGYSFLENNVLKVGYSFDYVVQNQEAKRPTSHEVFIRYDLPSLVLGGRKAVKTPRFSF